MARGDPRIEALRIQHRDPSPHLDRKVTELDRKTFGSPDFAHPKNKK